jgi:hypothetical protein
MDFILYTIPIRVARPLYSGWRKGMKADHGELKNMIISSPRPMILTRENTSTKIGGWLKFGNATGRPHRKFNTIR